MNRGIVLAGVLALATGSASYAQDSAPGTAPAAAAAPAAVPAPAPTAEIAAPTAAASPASAPETAKPVAASNLAPVGSADGCELHLWPAERMTSMTTGWLGGGLLDAAIHGKTDSSNQSLMASALDSPSQLSALTALDLRTMLQLSPGTTIILHDTPLERHTMNKIKDRRSDSKAACYSELIIADVFYQKAAIYGRSLRTLFMLREFGNDAKIDFEYKSWGGNGLKLFPPKEGEDAVAALDELVSVFKKNFDEYATNERKAPRVAKR